MTLLELALILATLLSALTAGFVFSFASVVMPGIGNLTDKEAELCKSQMLLMKKNKET